MKFCGYIDLKTIGEQSSFQTKDKFLHNKNQMELFRVVDKESVKIKITLLDQIFQGKNTCLRFKLLHEKD